MRKIVQTSQFKTDLKKIARSGKYNKEDLLRVLDFLVNDKPLPPSYRDHSLSGELKQYRECHIKPDWLLIYKIEKDTVYLIRTGSHSELF